MKRVIVTGATSFIGSPLVEKLSNSGFYVYAVVRPKSKNINNIKLNSNVEIVECDLNDISKLDTLINEKCDACFHIAWNGTRYPERDDKDIQFKNYCNSIDAYESSKRLGCTAFISTGSQAEYGHCEGIVDDNYPTNPVTEYGKAKLLAHDEIQKRCLKDNIKFGWIRIFSCYGYNDYDNSLVSMCIRKMKTNEDIILTKGIQLWNYVFIDDVINILLELLLNNNYQSETFNVCSNDTRPLKEYVYELKSILASNSNLLFGAKDYNESEGVVSFKPLNQNVSNILHYDNYVSFKEGIDIILKFNGSK